MNYLDTSVVVPLYYPEVGSAAIGDFLRRETSDLVISPLVEVEFFSALGLKVRRGELSAEEARRIGTVFAADLEHGIYQLQQVREKHYRQAKDWIARFDLPLRSLDGLHLAIAVDAELQLVTADVRLARSAELCGVVVVLLTED